MVGSGDASWGTVRRAAPRQRERRCHCVTIVEGLGAYFTPDVADKVRASISGHSSWIALEGDDVAGFCIVEHRGALAAEVLWAAVAAARRGRGIGTALLTEVLGDLRTAGVRLVEVKTLDAMSDYAPYVATRAFWAGLGFVQIDTIDPLPGWEPGNPAAILVAALATTWTPSPTPG